MEIMHKFLFFLLEVIHHIFYGVIWFHKVQKYLWGAKIVLKEWTWVESTGLLGQTLEWVWFVKWFDFIINVYSSFFTYFRGLQPIMIQCKKNKINLVGFILHYPFYWWFIYLVEAKILIPSWIFTYPQNWFVVAPNHFARQLHWGCSTEGSTCSCRVEWESYCCYSIEFAWAHSWCSSHNVLEFNSLNGMPERVKLDCRR